MKTILFLLISFVAVTATLSGLLMISKPDGEIMKLPLSLLEGTPFKNYLIPGILLTVLVGGSHIVAVFLNLQRHAQRYNWALTGGIILSGWIIIQMILIGAVHWLHIVYLLLGVLILLISYQLKGKWAV